MLLRQAFPFELQVPNAETQAAMAESRAVVANRRNGESRFAAADALFADLEKNSGK